MTPATKSKKQTPELGPRLRPFVIPDGVDLPPAVAEANERVRGAAIGAQEAAEIAEAAAREARTAGDVDRTAAIQALDSGSGTFEVTSARKAAEAKEATLHATAAEALLPRRTRALRTAIRETPDYLRDRQAELEVAREEIADALVRLPELFANLERAQALARPARRITEEAWSGPVFEQTRSDAKREKAREKAERLREQRGPRDLPSFEQCLADLRFIVEQEL